MNNVEKIKEILGREYYKYDMKIEELDKKIRIMKKNNIDSKFMIACGFSIAAWFFYDVFFSAIVIGGVVSIPVNLFAHLSIAIPILAGLTCERLLAKMFKVKEKLKAFSKAKSQSEEIEELTRYEIESEKLINSKKVLKRAYDYLNAKQNLCNSLSNQYNITVEKEDNRSITDIELSIEKLNEILDQEKKKLDVVTEKVVLEDKFWRIRSKTQRAIEFFGLVVIGAVGFGLGYESPINHINLYASNIEVPLTMLGLFGSAGLGGLIFGGYSLKRTSDNIHAFKNINKELGQEALSDTIDDLKLDDSEQFDVELEETINNAYAVKLQLELDKQKLNSMTQIPNEELDISNPTKKLSKDELVCNKDSVIATKDGLNEQFFAEQEDYGLQLGLSPIKEEQGPRLVKVIKHRNGRGNN